MTLSGHIARITRLVSKDKKWVLQGAIYDPITHVWCMANWTATGKHTHDPYSLKSPINFDVKELQ